ncbi:MAG: hypothetical protein J0L97_06060 [Alphaproteobacteria bacterium]|nr:hypothetical protein [Alphaproteobacteria bacterium]
MDTELVLFFLLGLAFGVVLALIFIASNQNIREYERGLLYKKGKLKRVLEPGMYWYNVRTTAIEVIDMRPQTHTAGQELTLADGKSFLISTVLHYRVTDPQKYWLAAANAYRQMDALLMSAVSQFVSPLDQETLMRERYALPAKLLEHLKPSAEAFGVALESLHLREMVPVRYAQPRHDPDYY